jgi:hypothetical protein
MPFPHYFTPSAEMLADGDFLAWQASLHPSLDKGIVETHKALASLRSGYIESPDQLIAIAERMVDVDLTQLERRKPTRFFSGRVALMATTSLLSLDGATYDEPGWVPDVTAEDIIKGFTYQPKVQGDADETEISEESTPDKSILTVLNNRGRSILAQTSLAVNSAKSRHLRKHIAR